jgi:hypothetical protein
MNHEKNMVESSEGQSKGMFDMVSAHDGTLDEVS